ncbi:hypothetical protein Moror_4696 [Moniliophthora roreri MCA 2997]|uniref:Uncharacterized protein n=1 Tax=Moniliophthora roreri (strain MCA 2997) TaxID=1381753 RepID=V2WZL6_MONRO|nr:hypothetical protein Moror_4696 [Moniliophthora roreri MCA 2997]
MPSHESVVFTPLEYSTGRVIYEAEDTDLTQRTSGYGTFKSSFSRSVVDLHQEKPRISIFHLNLDNTASDSNRQSKLEMSSPSSSPPSSTRPPRMRNRTMSCDHLTKVVHTVRSARVPKITIPCAQAVRNMVKCRTPGSSTTEPHFEIVTPVIYVPVDVKMVDDEDARASETETPQATFFPRYPEPMPVPQSAPPSMSWPRTESSSTQPSRLTKAKERSILSSPPPEISTKAKEGSLSDQSHPDLVPIPSSAPPVVFANQTSFSSESDPVPSSDPRPTTLKKPRPLPVPPVLSTSTTGNKTGKPRRCKRLGGADVYRELPPLPTA